MVMDPLMNALAMTDPNSGWSAGGRPSDLLASLGPPKLCCHAVLFDLLLVLSTHCLSLLGARMLLCGCAIPFRYVNLLSPASTCTARTSR